VAYEALEAEASRDLMSETCRIRLVWGNEEDGEAAHGGGGRSSSHPPSSSRPRSVFYKRIVMSSLAHARLKQRTAPQKLARDVESYRVEAAFLASAACAALLEAGGVSVARALSVEQRPCADEPIDSRFALVLHDFSPDDGWRQLRMLPRGAALSSLSSLARFHAFFWRGSRFWRGGAASVHEELRASCWGSATYWQPSMQPPEQMTQVASAWETHLARFGEAFTKAPELAGVDLPTLGVRLQSVAAAVGAEAHPFDRHGQLSAAADLSEAAAKYCTLIHGDPKAANFFLRGEEGARRRGDEPVVAMIDFQWTGFGLAATDVAHHIIAALEPACLSAADGTREATLLDHYHAKLCVDLADFGVADSAEDAAESVLSRAELQLQYESAFLDMCRIIFAYHWMRLQISPGVLERNASSLQKNAYNKSLPNAVWLVARCDAILRRRAARGEGGGAHAKTY
jgi:Ser/Thr protein kinase RdoA (MazF antagonist)